MKTFIKISALYWLVHAVSDLLTYVVVQRCVNYPVSWQIGSGWQLLEYKIGVSKISVCIFPFLSHSIGLLNQNWPVHAVEYFTPIVGALGCLSLYLSIFYYPLNRSVGKIAIFFGIMVAGLYQGLLFRQIYMKYIDVAKTKKSMDYSKNLMLPGLMYLPFSSELTPNENIFFELVLCVLALQLLPLPYTSLGDMIGYGLMSLHPSTTLKFAFIVISLCVTVLWLYTIGLIFDLAREESIAQSNAQEQELRYKVRLVIIAEMLRLKRQLLLQKSPYSLKYDYIFDLVIQNNLYKNLLEQTLQKGRELSDIELKLLTDLYVGQKDEIIKKFHYHSWGVHDN